MDLFLGMQPGICNAIKPMVPTMEPVFRKKIKPRKDF